MLGRASPRARPCRRCSQYIGTRSTPWLASPLASASTRARAVATAIASHAPARCSAAAAREVSCSTEIRDKRRDSARSPFTLAARLGTRVAPLAADERHAHGVRILGVALTAGQSAAFAQVLREAIGRRLRRPVSRSCAAETRALLPRRGLVTQRARDLRSMRSESARKDYVPAVFPSAALCTLPRSSG